MDISAKVERFAISIPDLDQPIYRIFSARRFRQLLVKNQIGLVEPRMWDDPMESAYRSCTLELDGSSISLGNLGLRWYGQCWTYNRDSDAMWRIYSPDKYGVRLQTTPRQLLAHMHSLSEESWIYLGGVSYRTRAQILHHLAAHAYFDFVNNGHPDSIVRTLLMKRPEFEHEHEVRLLFHDHAGHVANRGVVDFSFDVNQVGTEIALDPRISGPDFVAEQALYELLGARIPIIQSDLYQLRNIRLISQEQKA